MKSNRKLATFITCVMVFSFAIAQGSSDRRALRDSRSVTLPTYAILDEQSEPLIASDGKAGFISSVTGGMLISFNLKTGKVLSSIVVGKSAGPASMIETDDRRLIAVASANEPDQGHPATISVIDASSARQLDLKSILVLPPNVYITPQTRALLTEDGRYCLIASSFSLPELMVFDVETEQIVSQLPIFGRPSEMALYDKDGRRTIAIVSAETNYLSLFRLEAEGHLSSAANFIPSDASFSESNNPVFSADGRAIYVAASTGDRLLAVDSRSGAQFASLSISTPHRITAIRLSDGSEMIGVMRMRRPVDNAPGGVTLVTIHKGQMAIQSEFTPPDDIEFSPSNNVEFDEDASAAFVASKSGLLFAFNTETGELESHHLIGNHLNRVTMNRKARTLAAVRSATTGDEIVIVSFDVVAEDEPGDTPVPVITSLKPDVVEQGRAKNLRVLIRGENFTDGVALLVNGNEVATDRANDATTLATKLGKELFDQAGDIIIQVRASNGDLSSPASLRVVRPADPIIDKIKPEEVPGPSGPFTLKVLGKNFRRSSTIFVAGQPLNTERLSDEAIRAQVPSELAGVVNRFTVQVRDLAVPDVVSNERELTVFGPRIQELKTGPDAVVAGAGSFKLKIIGANFREGAQVEINGNVVPSARVERSNRANIKADVPSRFAQEAGELAVVVRNPDGSSSEPLSIDAHAPEISSFNPGQLLAGTSDVKVDIRGANFRKQSRVYVGKEGVLALRVPRQRVRFRSKERIVVTLADEFNELLRRPGELKFQVVNPNDSDGVPSADRALEVSGPQIESVSVKSVKNDDSLRSVVIEGANFRRGAIVEFIRAGDVFRRDDPAKSNNRRLVVTLRAKKLEALAGFQVRVVNPGNIKSNEADLPAADSN